MQIWTKSSSSTVFNGKWFVLRYCKLFLPDWSKLLAWHLDLSLVSQKIQRWWLNSRKRLRNIRILWLLTLKKNIQNCLTKRTVSIWIPFLCYLVEVAHKVTRWCFFSPSFCRLAFFKAAYELFEADYYVKADDDIYLRPGNHWFYPSSLCISVGILIFHAFRSTCNSLG